MYAKKQNMNKVPNFFSRPNTEDSWRFANWGIVPSIGIMAFGKMTQRVYTEATI
jgi:hypothetical protein